MDFDDAGSEGGSTSEDDEQPAARSGANGAAADAKAEGQEPDPPSFSRIDLRLPEAQLRKRFPLFPGELLAGGSAAFAECSRPSSGRPCLEPAAGLIITHATTMNKHLPCPCPPPPLAAQAKPRRWWRRWRRATCCTCPRACSMK